jgi:hypothetical protein
MIRFGGVLWFIMMGVWIYALLDVITTDSSLVRNLSKMTWVFIVFIGSIIGAVLWFVAGRPEKAGFKPGDTTYRKPISFRAPDDDPDFLRNVGPAPSPTRAEPPRPATPPTPGRGLDGPPPQVDELHAWEADLARREEELRRREEGSGSSD